MSEMRDTPRHLLKPICRQIEAVLLDIKTENRVVDLLAKLQEVLWSEEPTIPQSVDIYSISEWLSEYVPGKDQIE
jgi:hypothetical protein